MPQRYYEVMVTAAKGGPKATFTYRSEELLNQGSLVQVSLGRKSSLGIIKSKVTKPDFATKAIDSQLPTPALPKIYLKLAQWIADYYVTPLGRVWQTFLPSASLKVGSKIRPTDKPYNVSAPKITLTTEQSAAIDQIDSSSQSNFLLFGATGSGKTQVYLDLTKRALDRGQSAIILVPEISLTPQMIQQLGRVFGSNILLTHSAQRAAARRDVWLAALMADRPKVIVGPRSALFLPLPSLGYIFIDEAHDSSYKQDQAPRYNAQHVAAQLAKLSGAKLVLGTATPAITTRYSADKGKIELIKMTKPVFEADVEPPKIVDLKDKANLRQSYLLSEPLIAALGKTLTAKKQSLLFLNRRGSARLIMCRACGWRADCPNCQIPLTWHGDDGRMRCHWCGYQSVPPPACPNCGNLDIKFVGSGTKGLEAELKKIFPEARLARLDRDSFDPNTIDKLYGQLQKGKIDILVGTQMITKGLDLPGVETVGIILADNLLYVPDFSASERAFQMLYQVSGRSGRRAGGISRVIIQTYSPDHPAIVHASNRDYETFYEYELPERRSLKYPPFTYLMKLSITKSTRASAQSQAQKLADQLKKLADVTGPAPSWQETQGGRFNWQIIVKSPHRHSLVEIARQLPTDWTHDLDPIDLL